MLDQRTDWTTLTPDEKVEAVRPLADASMSASEIAAQYRNATRNGVLSVCHRAGIRLGSAKVNNRVYGKPKAHGNKNQPKVNAIVRRAEAIRQLPPQPDDETDVGVDVTNLVGLMDLNDTRCRWPVGPETGVKQLFCGVRKDRHAGPYCPEHTRKSEVQR